MKNICYRLKQDGGKLISQLQQIVANNGASVPHFVLRWFLRKLRARSLPIVCPVLSLSFGLHINPFYFLLIRLERWNTQRYIVLDTLRYVINSLMRRKELTDIVLDFPWNIQQLVINNLYNFKTLCTGYTIHEDITMNVHRILCRKYTIFILTCCIYQLNFIILAIYSCTFRKCWKTNSIV